MSTLIVFGVAFVYLIIAVIIATALCKHFGVSKKKLSVGEGKSDLVTAVLFGLFFPVTIPVGILVYLFWILL